MNTKACIKSFQEKGPTQKAKISPAKHSTQYLKDTGTTFSLICPKSTTVAISLFHRTPDPYYKAHQRRRRRRRVVKKPSSCNFKLRLSLSIDMKNTTLDYSKPLSKTRNQKPASPNPNFRRRLLLKTSILLVFS